VTECVDRKVSMAEGWIWQAMSIFMSLSGSWPCTVPRLWTNGTYAKGVPSDTILTGPRVWKVDGSAIDRGNKRTQRVRAYSQ
jgi:hypothetical protein